MDERMHVYVCVRTFVSTVCLPVISYYLMKEISFSENSNIIWSKCSFFVSSRLQDDIPNIKFVHSPDTLQNTAVRIKFEITMNAADNKIIFKGNSI